uniref:N-acetylmuramoyl-L-alanine amidase n=1 Tax=Pseudomonas phage RVTF4 TaxID=3236931 RepID=A0AB39CD30_9VIRU
MAESNKKGMISGMDSLISISGEEFLEVIRLESDGSYKNYKLLVSKIRNNQGLSAYEIAVQNGFVGTVDEWLASLEGKSAYQIAVDAGFVGDEAAFIASLKGEKGEDGNEGKSIYDIALENGFIGTEADFLKTLVGKSAYQTALDNGFVGTEAEWLLSIKGDKGDDGDVGPIGPDGKSAFEVWQALPGNAGKTEDEFFEDQKGVTGDSAYEAAVAGGFVGTEAEWLKSLEGKSAYEIAKELDPTLTDESEFIKSLEGKTAFEVAKEAGFQGTEAEWLESLEGKSAYQIAKDGGFVGTESQWLASLEGSDGNDGKSAFDIYKELPGNENKTEAEFIESLKGEDGTNGTNGTNGEDGADGESAFDAYKKIPGNENKTEADFIASLKGEKGEDGTNGTDGKSAYEVAKDDGFVGTVEQWLESLVGEKGDIGQGVNVIATIEQDEYDQIVADGTSQPGDAYIVGVYLYIFNGVDWVKSNSIMGPAGQGLNYLGQWPDNVPLPLGPTYKAGDTYVWKNQGITSLYTLVITKDESGVETKREWVDIGVPGPQGASVYETWLKQPGNAGKPESEFLEAMKIKGDKGERGNDGTNGTNGVDGKSAYEVAVENGFVGTVEQWEASLVGPEGQKGDPAVAFEIKGRLTDESELPTPGVPSEAYYVGKNLFVWLADETKWENFGSLNGDSAYQTWLEQPGNAGKTEEEFLESLKGQSAYKLWADQPENAGKTEQEFLTSLKGKDGINGTNGIDGTDGKNLQVEGTKADLAEIQAIVDPQDQEAWVALDTGHLHIFAKGTWVDAGPFRGEDGKDGTNGTNGTDGKSAYETFKEIPGNEDKTEQEFIDSLKGKDGTNGTNGTDGEDGRNVQITGSVANEAALPTGAAQQDAYTVRDTGHLFMWIATTWVDLGQFKGDKGDTGDQGEIGLTGLGLNIVAEVETLADRPDPATLQSGDAVFVRENKSLYQLNAQGGWNVGINIEGPVGPDGPQGEKGDPGGGLKILGKYATLGELQAEHAQGTAGDAYLVGQNLYAWVTDAWTDLGPVVGPRGEQGPIGKTGLKGEKGVKGDRGALWLKLEDGVLVPTPVHGTPGDWAVNAQFDTYYKVDDTNWVHFGKLTAGDVWKPSELNIKMVWLNTSATTGGWVVLPVDEVSNPEEGVYYVRTRNATDPTKTEWTQLPHIADITAKSDTDQWVRVFKAAADAPEWAKLTVPDAGIPEAPTTAGKGYLRSGASGGSWIEGLTAPATAGKFLRTQTSWEQFNSYDLAYSQSAAATSAIAFDLSKQQMVEVDNSGNNAKTVTLSGIPGNGRCTTAVVVVKGNGGTVAFTAPNMLGGEVKWNSGTQPVYTAGYSVVTLLVYATSANTIVIGATGAQTLS